MANASVIRATQGINARIRNNAQATATTGANAIWESAIATMDFRVLYAKIK